jgi:hypothetical protein
MSKKEIKIRLDEKRKTLQKVREAMDIVDVVDDLSRDITKLNNQLLAPTGKE